MPVDEKIKSGLAQGTFVVQSDGVIECVDTIELQPTSRSYWKNAVDFHPNLTVPSPLLASSDENPATIATDSSSASLFLTFDAKARECLEVALSPIPKFTVKSTTLVRLGGSGNTETTISFRQGKQQQQQQLSKRATGRVCRHDKWVKYWLCYQRGKVSVGIGDTPGQQRITSMQLPSVPIDTSKVNDDASMKEGIAIADNEKKKGAQEDSMDEEKNETITYCAVGFRNASVKDRQAPTLLLIRSIRLSREIPQQVMDRLANEPDQDDEMIVLGQTELETLTATDQQAVQLLLDHKEACAKARARAVKFNVPYVEPDLTTSLNWSDARRLLANPTSQRAFFATGIDLSSTLEVGKRNQRKERFFGGTDAAAATLTTTTTIKDDVDENCNWLPIEQAWNKIDLCGMQRMDPPVELWLEQPSSLSTEKNQPMFAMEPATLVKEKIHLFSMDWAAFKQIRTGDILKHFSEFGPTYVEWLGDLSCNVLFEDEYSAARALNRMAQEAPVGKDPDLGRMGWRFGKTYLHKVANDKYGKKGTTARLLMRLATSKDILQARPSSWPKPPEGFTKRKVLGPESDPPPKQAGTDLNQQQTSQKRRAPSTEEMLNGALSSSRGGFSLDDLVSERAAKRTKKLK